MEFCRLGLQRSDHPKTIMKLMANNRKHGVALQLTRLLAFAIHAVPADSAIGIRVTSSMGLRPLPIT